MNHKKHLLTIFLAVFINITGFAIILPLSPAMLEFYLPSEEATSGVMGEIISSIKTVIASLGKEKPAFTTAVFFGCFLASLYAFLQFIFAPICGRISDRYGRRPVMLFTLTGAMISYGLWAVAASFNLFIISRILAGVMAANLSVVTAAMADVTSKEDRTKGMMLVGIAFGLGFLFGPAMGGLLTQINLLSLYPSLGAFGINPFSACALVAMMLSAINLLWIYMKFDETLPVEKRLNPQKSHKFMEAFRAQSSSILRTNFSYFIFILSFSGLEFTLAFIAAERFSYGPKQIGYLFLYIGFILIFARGYIVRKFSTKVEERMLAIAGVVSGIISFSTIAFAFTQSVFILGSSFLAIAIALTSTSLSSLVSLYSTERTQGRDLGLFNSAGSLARAFGPLLASIPYIYLGAQGAYISISSLLFIPLFLIFFLPKPDKTSTKRVEPLAEALEETETPTV